MSEHNNEERQDSKMSVEDEIIDLYLNHRPFSKDDYLRWLQLGLVYFHDAHLSLRTIENCQVVDKEDGMMALIFNDEEYYLPKP